MQLCITDGVLHASMKTLERPYSPHPPPEHRTTKKEGKTLCPIPLVTLKHAPELCVDVTELISYITSSCVP